MDRQCHAEALATMVQRFQPDVIGLSLRNIDDALIQRRETFFEDLKRLTNELRQHSSAPVVLGGSGYSIFPEALLERSGADYGIHGEGEQSFVALLEALEHRREPAGIPGLVWANGRRAQLQPRAGNLAPDELAEPLRPAELASFYLQRSSMLNLQTQRGCALHCCYCTYPWIEGRTHRRRPAEAVAAEIEGLERAGAGYAFIVDSVFNSSPHHVVEICEALIRRGTRLKWCCFLRPQGLTPDLMRLMARAGLSHVEFGSDSFCGEVLTAYGKHLTFEDILASSELARQAGVDYCHFLICGGPGETEATLETSFAHSQRLNDAVIMARAGMRVYPGTPLFDRLNKERGQPAAEDLLRPFYYLAPPLTEAGVLARLRDFARRSPNWIVDDPPPPTCGWPSACGRKEWWARSGATSRCSSAWAGRSFPTPPPLNEGTAEWTTPDPHPVPLPSDGRGWPEGG
jgi:radical SAM superfamily enzyme YgiQ (UPF0313 family)